MLLMKVDGSFTDATLATLKRDPLLSGDNSGVRFLFDAAFPFCYAAGAPANGAAVADISEHANGSFVKSGTQVIGFAGNGFDFAAMTSVDNTPGKEYYVGAPASVWADIYAQKKFLICVYIRMPSAADYNTDASLYPMFASSTASNGYQGAADPLTIAQANGQKLSFRRQTAIGTADSLDVSAVGHYGNVAQIAYWRNAAGCGARLRSAAGTTLSTGVIGADNSADYSGAVPRFGSVAPFTNYLQAGHRTARNYRLYRGFMENLYTSGRDPVAVLDADYARTVARNVFT